jgi:hypothetical protein
MKFIGMTLSTILSDLFNNRSLSWGLKTMAFASNRSIINLIDLLNHDVACRRL